MVNADFELERLRASLRARGYGQQDIDYICRSASSEMGQAISDALAAAVEEAAVAGQEVRSEDFVSELRAVALNNDYYISTDSGNLDFSEPPFPMMANLLKNPKVAKDGSLYKVIPVGSKNEGAKNFSSLADLQAGIARARDAAADASTTGREISTGPATFSGSFAAQKVSARNNTVRKNIASKTNQGGIKFRTVSSKQDPMKNWVQPAKNKDMTSTVTDINMRLRQTIDDIIVSVVQKYEETT